MSNNESNSSDSDCIIVAARSYYLKLKMAEKVAGYAGWPVTREVTLLEGILPTCHTCHIADIQQGVNYMPKIWATSIGDKIHGDLIGPILPLGKKSYRYFLLLTDDCTWGKWIYHFRHKSKTLNYLQRYYQLIKIQSNHSIKIYKLNDGTKLMNNIIEY